MFRLLIPNFFHLRIISRFTALSNISGLECQVVTVMGLSGTRPVGVVIVDGESPVISSCEVP